MEVVPGLPAGTQVKSDSNVETYLAAKLLVDNWRWAGVPFICGPEISI